MAIDIKSLEEMREILREPFFDFCGRFDINTEVEPMTDIGIFECQIRQNGCILSGHFERFVSAAFEIMRRSGKSKVKLERLNDILIGYYSHEYRHWQQACWLHVNGLDQVKIFEAADKLFGYTNNPLELDAYRVQAGIVEDIETVMPRILGMIMEKAS